MRYVAGCVSKPARALVLALVVAALMAGCTADDADTSPDRVDEYGGAGDLPGALPEDVAFQKAPRSAVTAPDFSAELLDGTPVAAAQLWEDRPLVLVFTASSCNECASVHREATEVVDEHEGAVALLAVVRANDTNGGREYARDLRLDHPIAAGAEGMWLNYAAGQPPLVVLIAPGGKVLRGWPGEFDADELAKELEGLYESSPPADE